MNPLEKCAVFAVHSIKILKFFLFQPNWLEMGGGEEQLGSDELRYAVRLG